jgi:hypothetical protein
MSFFEFSMNVDDWMAKFKPVKNLLATDDSFDGCLFDTSPEELKLVREANPKCVWTLLDWEDGRVITNGCQYVNRMGYFISEVPFDSEGGRYLEVQVEEVACHD